MLAVAGTAEGAGSRGSFPALQSCFTGLKAVARATSCTTLATPQETPLHLGTALLEMSPAGDSLYASGGAGGRILNFSRAAGTSSLGFRDCVTGTTDGPPSPCSAIPTAQRYEGSGLAYPGSVAVSPDGRSAYALAGEDRTIATFSRDPATGTLSFRQCLGGPNPDNQLACTPLPGIGEHHLSLLTGALDVAVSPDGRSVYVASYVGSVVEFQRDTDTGDLRFQGCLSDAEGVQGCQPVRGPKQHPKVEYADQVIVSPDGRYVYVDGPGAILAFARDPQSGALRFHSCATSSVRRNPLYRIKGCTFFPKRHDLTSRHLVYAEELALSPDGRWLYGSSRRGTVEVLRVTSDGRFKPAGCLTANLLAKRYCALIPGARRDPQPVFSNSAAAVIAPDGRHLYANALGGSSLASFRLFKNGGVRFEGCVTGATRNSRKGYLPCEQLPGSSLKGAGSGLNDARGLAVSPDSKWIYAGSSFDQSLMVFRR